LSQIYKSLQEGLGGIREVILDGSQKYYLDLYKVADLPYRKALADNVYLSAQPRFLMEALGMTLLAVIAFFFTSNGGTFHAYLPILGSMAMGAQKLLPLLQQLYSSWSIMKGGESVLNDTLDFLDQKISEIHLVKSSEKLQFNSKIEIKDVSFRYSKDSDLVLQNFSLKISKGSRFGFIGKTGAGKSTLIDLIMGLLIPTNGFILIDDIVLTEEIIPSWQRKISHVPQSIYLSDTSIYENIALGVPKEEINFERVHIAAKKAQIGDFIESLPEKYSTFVGERGVRLSGGQRQRIGIARALYKEASVIIFDEATSALDSETEKAVMESIEALDKDLTILIIAHRLSTIEKCDMIVELK